MEEFDWEGVENIKRYDRVQVAKFPVVSFVLLIAVVISVFVVLQAVGCTPDICY